MATNFVLFFFSFSTSYHIFVIPFVRTEYIGIQRNAKARESIKRVYFMSTSIELELLTFSLHLKSIFDVEEVFTNGNPF